MDPTITLNYMCAVCFRENAIEIDLSAGRRQVFTEDCSVCCRPNVISCTVDDEGNTSVDVQSED